MACEGHPGHSFRSTVLGRDPESPLVEQKRARRDGSSSGLAAVALARSEHRRGNQRSDDRQVCGTQAVTVRKGRTKATVTLVNLSGGGAMIEGDLKAKLWDRLTLVLGEFGEVECAVRWIRGNRFGLEFAHETRIDCDAALRDETLRQVIAENFSGSEHLDAEACEEGAGASGAGPHSRAADRHPLIWSGMVHGDQDSAVARLRNISAGGAQIQSSADFKPGASVVLDLGNAGTAAATVCWTAGDQAGLAFAEPFDLLRLAGCRPAVAERKWAKPEYLRDESIETSPWASEWGRLSLKDLSQNLGG